MDNIVIPTDATNYKLIESFNSATGNIVTTAPVYSANSNTWSDSGTAHYQINTLAYLATDQTNPVSVAGIDVGSAYSKVHVKFLLPSGRLRVYIRKTSVADNHTGNAMNGYVVGITGTKLVSVSRVEDGAATTETNTDDALNGLFDPTTVPVSALIEDTGAQINVTINGITQTTTLDNSALFSGNTFTGINLKKTDDRVYTLRAW